MRFLHCSDVHITTDYYAGSVLRLGWRRWIALFELGFGGRAAAYARADQTLTQIANDLPRHGANHLVVSGDLTAYAMEAEFAGARKALSPWVEDRKRCTVIPGNHDRYTPGAFAQRRFEKHFGHLLVSDLPETAVEDGFPFVRLLGAEDAIVGLCSARVPRMPGLSYGVIGRPQLDALQKLLGHKSLAGRAVLVVVHHAPFRADGRPDKRHHGLIDARELLSLLPGDRFAVLHGHIHRRYHHPATDTRPHIFGAGSSTQAGKEGYWLIETQGGRVRGGSMAVPAGVPEARSG